MYNNGTVQSSADATQKVLQTARATPMCSVLEVSCYF
jgi:hypothetical protein